MIFFRQTGRQIILVRVIPLVNIVVPLAIVIVVIPVVIVSVLVMTFSVPMALAVSLRHRGRTANQAHCNNGSQHPLRRLHSSLLEN